MDYTGSNIDYSYNIVIILIIILIQDTKEQRWSQLQQSSLIYLHSIFLYFKGDMGGSWSTLGKIQPHTGSFFGDSDYIQLLYKFIPLVYIQVLHFDTNSLSTARDIATDNSVNNVSQAVFCQKQTGK